MEKTSFLLLVVLITVFVWTCGVEGNNNRKRKYFSHDEEQPRDEGVLGTIKNGFKMAGKFFGFDAASGVANLVAEAFSESKRTPINKSTDEEGSWGKTLLTGLMRTLSLDTGKISAIVLNAIIFLAQLLTTSIVPTKAIETETPRKIKDGSPIDWILQNPSDSVRSLIEVAQDEKLIDSIIESLKENTKEKDTSCIQLLMCKMAPFVWRMQKALSKIKIKFENKTMKKDNGSDIINNKDENDFKNEAKLIIVNNNDTSDNGDALFRYLPEVMEFIEHGELCESKYDECRLLD